MKVLLRASIVLLQGIYWIMKRFPSSDKKILFISRQSYGLPLDFRLLAEELKRRDPSVKMRFINRRFDRKRDLAAFPFILLASMCHLATARVCILDSYWPAVSLLTHRKSLYVLQLWHSIGKVKKSGLEAVGKRGGRSSTLSQTLRMHQNYDAVVAGGAAWNPFYCASFGIEEDKILNLGLPRIDYLLEQAPETRRRILEAYPALRHKTVVLYAPTFRKTGQDPRWTSLLESPDSDKFQVILKSHPNQILPGDFPGLMTCPEFSALELLTAADYLVTDYSAIALEAAVLNLRTYYYVYDYDAYVRDTGLNIDLRAIMAGCVFESAAELWSSIAGGSYPQKRLDSYRKAYLPQDLGHSTGNIADVLLEKISAPKE